MLPGNSWALLKSSPLQTCVRWVWDVDTELMLQAVLLVGVSSVGRAAEGRGHSASGQGAGSHGPWTLRPLLVQEDGHESL